MAEAAAAALRRVKESGGRLLVLTGAGMSVQSGVPVFRRSDGTMSSDFLRFLDLYNAARRRSGLSPASEWFDFSVPQMFQRETEGAAWAYWRWRELRARVSPGADYAHLMRLVRYFGAHSVFVCTSNVDSLHITAGLRPEKLLEVHGSLKYLQCATPCTDELWDADGEFLDRLAGNDAWVPRCPRCEFSCLRPNVMIFGDWQFVGSRLEAQEEALGTFCKETPTVRLGDGTRRRNWAVLEVGAGTVVPSIRMHAERRALEGRGLVRVNPSQGECNKMEVIRRDALGEHYFPLVTQSEEALRTIADLLCREET